MFISILKAHRPANKNSSFRLDPQFIDTWWLEETWDISLSIPVQIIKKGKEKMFFPDGIHSGQRKENLISYRLYFGRKKKNNKDLLCLPPLSFLVILLFSPHIHSNAIYFSDYGYFPYATTGISNRDRTRIWGFRKGGKRKSNVKRGK